VISELPQQDPADAIPADVSDCPQQDDAETFSVDVPDFPQQDVSGLAIVAGLPLLATFP
jgi:hypothetical protein